MAAVEAGAAQGSPAQSREIVRRRAVTMLALVRQYLMHYQKVMFDRTDEGMLASYWIAAGQYAYRYAYPDRYKEAGIFQVSPAGAKVYWTGQPEEIRVQASEK